MTDPKTAAPRVHTILRMGNFTKFRSLDLETAPENPPSEKVTGLCFLYMQMPAQEFVAVGVEVKKKKGAGYERILLRAPVLLVPERHTDAKGFAAPPQFGDESAMRLLVDMIIANPELRDALGRLVVALGRSLT